jgi:hypothetical protein
MVDPVHILNGPSKWDLVMSVFEEKLVSFTCATGDIDVYVRAISHDYLDWYSTQEIRAYAGNMYERSLSREVVLLEGAEAAVEDSPFLCSRVQSVYAAYLPDRRSGILRIAEERHRHNNWRDAPLHMAWGDLIFGSSAWRSKED